MNIRWIAGISFVLFLFVVAIGSDLFLSAKRSRTSYEMEEPPAHFKDRLRSFKEKRTPTSRPSMMTDRVSTNWIAAMNSMEIERKQQQKQEAEQEKIRKFLDTEAGKYLDQGLKLLSQGRRQEARSYITHALELHAQIELPIYMILLKALLHSYFEKEDAKAIDERVISYLDVIKREHTESEFQNVVNDLMGKIEEKMGYAE
jgi:hypothetical protein